MTFLELANSCKLNCGISGPDLTTTVGASGDMKRICSWINDAWTELQVSCDTFDFMRKTVTFNTVAGQNKYLVGALLDIPLTNFSVWRNDSFRQYLTSAGVATEIILGQYYDYAEYRDFYLLGSRKLVEGRPLYVTIEPQTRALVFGFIPNDVYTTSAEYFCLPQILAADTAVPTMPPRYHMAIVYSVMQKYGMFEMANEQIMAGKKGYDFLYNRLLNDYAPIIQATGNFI